MALSDYKITQEETAANGVVSAPDVLTGTAQENKAVFDKLINQTVMVKHNGLIDELSTSGAGDTGITDIPGLVAETVQEALEEINANVGEIIDPNNPETAGKIGSLPFQGVEAANVQDALEEIQQNLDAAVSDIQQDIPQAEEVLVTPFPGVTSDNVQDALEELNEKVEDIQSGVIPTGSITSDMIQDGAVTADKLGSDVTGDTIPTSDSDPTSISSQLSNLAGEKYTRIVSPPQSWAEVWALAPHVVYSWVQLTPLAWQPEDTPSGALRVELTIHNVADNAVSGSKSATLAYIDGTATLTRYVGEEMGTGASNGRWAKLATATSPQEFDLPLAEGWTGLAKYYKTQENICFIELDILKNATIQNGEVLATLPEGFRPSYLRMQPAIVYSPHGSTTIGVSPTGSVLFGDMSGSPSARNIYATLVFVADS